MTSVHVGRWNRKYLELTRLILLYKGRNMSTMSKRVMQPAEVDRGAQEVALVTGGAGFLGQHIVGLLQTRADHVREIRVLDLKPYTNILGHAEIKPVHSYSADITKLSSLHPAFEGVSCVYHIAGLISYGTFPDYTGMDRVNIQGTENVILACLVAGVARLIFCSTVDVVIGHDDIINGCEETTKVPDKFLFPGYPASKHRAECLVLKANGKPTQTGTTLHTISLRANVMYGELDPYYVTTGLRNAVKSGNTLYQVGNGTAKFQPVYVGNTAWAFLCADKALRDNPSIGGQFFYVPDETPIQNTFSFMQPFLQARRCKLSSFRLPYMLVYGFLRVAELVVWAFKPLVKISLPSESYSVKYINMNLYFSNNKAREVLKFQPLYSPDVARKRCMEYYKNVQL